MNTLIEVNTAQLVRLSADWSQIAGERVRVKFTGVTSTFVAQCSELAALRLEHEYNNRPIAEAQYNPNYEIWLFTLKRTA